MLKSLEVLYQVEKWEMLVSLAIQFNIISQYVPAHKGNKKSQTSLGDGLLAQVNFSMYSLPRSSERYTEQVTPLLVYAQRQLVLRIEQMEGPDLSHQACARYEAETGEKVSWADSHVVMAASCHT